MNSHEADRRDSGVPDGANADVPSDTIVTCQSMFQVFCRGNIRETMLQLSDVGLGNHINHVEGDNDFVVGLVKIGQRIVINSFGCTISRRWCCKAVLQETFEGHVAGQLS